jgi:hypothetical protein
MGWLHAGGHGREITIVTTRTTRESDLDFRYDDAVDDIIHAALRSGALPSLKTVAGRLTDVAYRASLTGGLLGATHELRLSIEWRRDHALAPQLAALGLVRQLPALAKLELHLYAGVGDEEDDDEPRGVQCPPFIPPSLKALSIETDREVRDNSLLCALPGMLGASGARLERLEVRFSSQHTVIFADLVNLAEALRCCSPTLKHFHLSARDHSCIQIRHPWADDYEDQMERLRVQWAEVLAGVSACRELQVLILRHIEVEHCFPPGAAFARLTHLEIHDRPQEHAGGVGLWELMASGGLPALATLKVTPLGRWGWEEVRTRMAPGLEAVAGTLTRLHLGRFKDSSRGQWLDEEEEGAYEVGLAVGKLRRLKDLTLHLSDDGRAYDALAQGLTASGGDPPLPLLWRLEVPGIRSHPDLLTSLLLPSVRVLVTPIFIEDSRSHHTALLMACALRREGYKHTWAVNSFCDRALRGIARCAVGAIRTQSACLLEFLHAWRHSPAYAGAAQIDM